MSRKMYAASEIAKLKLPELPTTIPSIHARAQKEGWHYETKIGLGGMRKMYEIPERYLPTSEAMPRQAVPTTPQAQSAPVAGAIMNGAIVNSRQLASAMRALDEYLKENGLVIDEPEVKAEIVAILYKYLQKDASGEDLQELLRVVMR
ncbi:hypothetical protein [Undibacterium sp. Ren11W]|uniref:hypothetical protein n=1 Tax=Undibacterium sp. Ren11W TaxID=3413045 RepID=UPI003BF266D7